MRRTELVLIVLVFAALVMTPVSSAAHTYSDPAGDYTRPPKRILHPDLRTLTVKNNQQSITFIAGFARSPRALRSLYVEIDVNRQRSVGLGHGRFRQADIVFDGSLVYEAYKTGERESVAAFISPDLKFPDPVRVGWMQASGRTIRLVVPTRFLARNDKGETQQIVLRSPLRFFVWAWGDAGMNVDRDLPDEDLAPNSGWFTYQLK